MIILLIVSFIVPVILLVYPLVSFCRYRCFRNPVLKSETYTEPVSIIIACYNEENYIRNKILSFLDKKEWIDGSEIIVVSAGSTDMTNEILKEFEDNHFVQIINSDVQLSKIKAVNTAVEYAKHKILVFSDCRQEMKIGSVKQLIHNFNDKNIGLVMSVLNDSQNDNRQSFFRNLINTLVYYDCQSGSGLNVYGALYAQRRSIFRKFPEDQLFDDLYVIISTLSQNKRLVQEPNAIIHDLEFNKYYSGERLERLVRGLLIFIIKERKMLFKINIPDLIRFMIFKYLKLLLPFSFLAMFISCIYYLFKFDNLFLTLTIISTTILSFVFKKTRNIIVLIIRINYHFITAIFKFFLLNKRSVKWDKLKVKPDQFIKNR